MNVREYLTIHELAETVRPALQGFTHEGVERIWAVPVLPCRGTSRGGYFKFKRSTGQLLGIYLNRALSTENAREVFLHELAHLLVCVRYTALGWRPEPHGAEWRSMMLALGQEPKTCVNREANQQLQAARTTRTYNYRCKDCGYIWQRARFWRNVERRVHTTCKTLAHGGHIERSN